LWFESVVNSKGFFLVLIRDGNGRWGISPPLYFFPCSQAEQIFSANPDTAGLPTCWVWTKDIPSPPRQIDSDLRSEAQVYQGRQNLPPLASYSIFWP